MKKIAIVSLGMFFVSQLDGMLTPASFRNWGFTKSSEILNCLMKKVDDLEKQLNKSNEEIINLKSEIDGIKQVSAEQFDRNRKEIDQVIQFINVKSNETREQIEKLDNLVTISNIKINAILNNGSRDLENAVEAANVYLNQQRDKKEAENKNYLSQIASEVRGLSEIVKDLGKKSDETKEQVTAALKSIKSTIWNSHSF